MAVSGKLHSVSQHFFITSISLDYSAFYLSGPGIAKTETKGTERSKLLTQHKESAE
jgi:hypothetical protein